MTKQEEATQENTIAIGKVLGMVEHLTKDVDKIIHVIELVPVVRVVSIEKRMAKLESACNKRSWFAFSTMLTILGIFAYKHFFGG